MGAVFSDDYSKDAAATIVASSTYVPGAKLHLFKSNHTPADGDVLATYTAIESTFPGYAAQTVTGWGAPVVSAHVATVTAAQLTFTRNATGATENVYGYYVTDAANTVLLWAELDPNAPIGLTNNGDQYLVTPSVAQQSAL
jgi:hypothetical protein